MVGDLRCRINYFTQCSSAWRALLVIVFLRLPHNGQRLMAPLTQTGDFVR